MTVVVQPISHTVYNSVLDKMKYDLDQANENCMCFRCGGTFLLLRPYLGNDTNYSNAPNVECFSLYQDRTTPKRLVAIIHFACKYCDVKRLCILPKEKWRLFTKLLKTDYYDVCEIDDFAISEMERLLKRGE